jgi:hypothetical protein
MKKRDHFEDLDIDGRTVLKKQGGRALTALIPLKAGTCDGLL